ncbi:MAG: hypothetical protein PHI18_00240 [bacterium]|nr:hypothetical protein [bacterium]
MNDIELGKPETRLTIRVSVKKGETTLPYLVQIWEPDEDFRHWTFTIPDPMQKDLYLSETVWHSPDGVNMAEAINLFREWLEEEIGNLKAES